MYVHGVPAAEWSRIAGLGMPFTLVEKSPVVQFAGVPFPLNELA